jgi:hypothetical protein
MQRSQSPRAEHAEWRKIGGISASAKMRISLSDRLFAPLPVPRCSSICPGKPVIMRQVAGQSRNGSMSSSELCISEIFSFASSNYNTPNPISCTCQGTTSNHARILCTPNVLRQLSYRTYITYTYTVTDSPSTYFRV